MSQHDFNIANQTASNARADINNALTALASLSSGSTAPSTTYANMLWYDAGNNILKMRAEADDAWINIGYLDQSADAFRILDNTQVVNTSGTQTGLLGDQSTATWEAGTSTTESLVSPAKVKAAVEEVSIGYGQSWQDVSSSRTTGTWYRNTTAKPIQVSVRGNQNNPVRVRDANFTSQVTLGGLSSGFEAYQFIVPPLNYYYVDTGNGAVTQWAELR